MIHGLMDQTRYAWLPNFFPGASQKAAINFKLLHQEPRDQTIARFDSQDLQCLQ